MPDAPHQTPEIAPALVFLDASNFATRAWVVRLPKGFEITDLNEPSAFAKVQRDRTKALRKFDSVLLIAYDETWIARATVTFADASLVTISKPSITQIGARFDRLPGDETYRTEWSGIGYDVIRKTDNAVIAHDLPSVAAAQREIDGRYPRATR